LSPYDRAVQDRLAGRTTQAIDELKDLTAKAPMDADVWLNLGLAYTAKGDFKAADAALAYGLKISPNYNDMRVAYARVALFRGQTGEARKRLEPAFATQPSDRDAQDLMKQINAAQSSPDSSPWRVDANASYSSLSNGLPAWREYDVAAGRQFSTGTAVSFAVEETQRFGQANTYVSGTVSQRIGRASVFVGYGGSPNATYRAKQAIQAGIVSPPVLLPDGANIVGEVDYGFSRYPAGDVQTIQPSATLTLNDSLAFTARYYSTLDERHKVLAGVSLRADATLKTRYHLSLIVASVPDSTAGVTTKVESYSMGVGMDFGSATNLHLNTTYEDRGTYRRNDYAVGVTHKF
jgi:YaiO family outer membrane protein